MMAMVPKIAAVSDEFFCHALAGYWLIIQVQSNKI
jgi:hypothetical protein